MHHYTKVKDKSYEFACSLHLKIDGIMEVKIEGETAEATETLARTKE